MAVFVGVPIAEGDVFGRDFDVASAGLDEAAGEEAALAEAAIVIHVETFARFEREIEGLGGRRGEEAVRGVHGAHEGFALKIAGVLIDGLAGEEGLVELAAAGEARGAELGGRANGGGGILGVCDEEGAVLGAEEAGGVKGFERGAFGADFEILADGDEGRHGGVAGAEGFGDHGADVGHGDGLRRNVAGVPVVLMAGVKDEAEVGGLEGADDRAAIDDFADALEAGGKLDGIDGGIDLREGAEDLIGADARGERRVAFGIPGFGLRHTTGHPDDDDGIGGGGRGGGADHAGFAAGERREGGGGGSAHEAATGDAGGDEFLRVNYWHVSGSIEILVS